MSTSRPHRHSGTANVRHCKEDALDDVEFERLFEGATRMRDYYGIQAQFAILVLGRLGLRRGELVHMKESWLDRRNEMIQIPFHEPCHGARDGDGICGYCRQLAEQRADINPDLSIEESAAMQWQAKTDAAARDVYYGFDARVRMYVERFFDRFDAWTWSSTAVNRRVKRAAEHADGLEPSDVRPHSLRATAATKLAAQGLEMHALMQHFGWAKPQTAEIYLSRNGRNTARQLTAMATR